jgi:hypothetical protein
MGSFSGFIYKVNHLSMLVNSISCCVHLKKIKLLCETYCTRNRAISNNLTDQTRKLNSLIITPSTPKLSFILLWTCSGIHAVHIKKKVFKKRKINSENQHRIDEFPSLNPY